MDQDYFSIDSILAGNQASTMKIIKPKKIQCVFKQELPNLGHLGGGSERDIAVLSKAQIPLWLAYILVYSDWADFNIPAAFGPKVRNALKAEAKSVRLSNLIGAGGMWYGFGKTITDILAEEQANEISNVLVQTFRARLVEVIDQAQHFAALGPVGGGGATGDVSASFREGLDATERELFTLAQESAKMTKKWYEETDKPRR